MLRTSAAFIAVFLISLGALPAYAQYGLPGVENSVSISLSPQNPQSGDSVHAIAESTLLDLSHSSITWSVNGKIVKQGTGETAVDFVAGAVGSVSRIHVDVASANVTASADALVAPTQIDLLFESDSYVPPFFRGRALPSAGTNVRLLALAHFIKRDSTEVPQSQITYTWKQNGDVVTAVSGRGKSSANLPSPSLFGTDTITVDAASVDGTYSGEASVQIPSIEPVLVLYEDHPLFGIMYHLALGGQTFVPESEMTFTAVPFFAQAESANDSRLQYEWSVNGKTIPADSVKPSEITIDARKSSGQALISLGLTHRDNLFMSASKSWGVTFSQGQGQSQNSAPGGSDPFHNSQ